MPTTALPVTKLHHTACALLFCLLTAFPAFAASPKPRPPAAASKAAPSPKAPASVATPVIVKDWGPYLDVAHELTYWDKAEIREWREKRDAEIGESLAAYTKALAGRLPAPGAVGTATENSDRPAGLRERDYLRLTAAQMLDYLQSDNRESLNNAARTIEWLKGKSLMPQVAYWTAYVKALLALEGDDSEQFVARVYDLWNNSVLCFAQGDAPRAAAPVAGTSTPTQFYYRNLINLVVNRAVVTRKMDGLNALGPLFLMLKERVAADRDGEGKYFATLIQRIADGLTAPDSDRYRLNYTVAMIEARRLQQAAAAKLDAEGMTEETQQLFDRSLQYNDLAVKWAASPRSSGVIQAVSSHLDSISFAIQRLPDNEKAKAYPYFAALPGREGATTLSRAMAIFNDVAAYSKGGWKKAGYENRELYLKATHRLWRSIMELCLWSGDFYLVKLNAAPDQQGLNSYAAPMQLVMDSYLYFLASQSSRGFEDAIPDSAYFGAAEAAEKLAFVYQRINAFSTDTGAYNLWFMHRLQATELFPLAPRDVAQTATLLKQDGRYSLFLDYYLPLAGRIKQSPAIRKWLEANPSDIAGVIRKYTGAIDDYFTDGVGSSAEGAAKVTTGRYAVVTSFQQLREEMQRKPDHPVHRLLKAFFVEEMQKSTNYTRLLKDPGLINQGL